MRVHMHDNQLEEPRSNPMASIQRISRLLEPEIISDPIIPHRKGGIEGIIDLSSGKMRSGWPLPSAQVGVT